jgi:hypothetical protein
MKAVDFQRRANTQSASWFLDQASAGRLDLDPPYQRRSVWNTEYKQFFIDSLIRNYPSPTLFLEVDIGPGRPTIYRVIDGKQRLTALLDFTSDVFATPASLNDLDLGGRYYSDLPEEAKVTLLEYQFEVETVSNASATELNEAFDRLNRNVARLNAQELRHARYGGAFIQKVEQLAEHPFWSETALATPAKVRRMQDVEYVSELYVVCMAGIQDGKDYLDDFYANNDEEIVGEEEADRLFLTVQDFLRELNSILPLRETRFANIADFYSLWAGALDLERAGGALPDAGESATRLREFAWELEEQKTDRSRDYLLAAVQGSNKGANRSLRARILSDVLTAT